MIELKTLPGGIPRALELADHYRLAGDPEAAESICLDVLALEPDHAEALVPLLLARVDLLDRALPGGVDRAREVLPRLGEYEQSYYAGLICERQAKVLLRQRGQQSGFVAYQWFRYAMEEYEDAARLASDRPEPVLRWNTCARIINRTPHCVPAPDEGGEQGIE